MKCFIFFHDWGKWVTKWSVERKYVDIFGHKVTKEVTDLRRECKRCGKPQIKQILL